MRLIAMEKTIISSTAEEFAKNKKSTFVKIWGEGWTYIKTVVDILREPVLILNKDFQVIAANEPFYRTFHVEQKDTEKKNIYELGDGQWNIPELRKLLEDILPKRTFFKGFEVDHDFPSIGRKVMMLNARQIHFKESAVLPPIILLAMEDITEMIIVAETLANHANEVEKRLGEKTEKLEMKIESLEKEIYEFKKK